MSKIASMGGTEITAGSAPAAFAGGAIIGALGGLIGLGGAEFRLPLLIGAFRFVALQAVILNKAMSLVVVASALPFRATTVPFAALAAHWTIIANLLAGSLLGAWCGACWATRIASHTLYRVIAALLIAIAIIMVAGHNTAAAGAMLTGAAQNDRWHHRWIRDRRYCCPARRSGRRAIDPDTHSALWCRYQACWQSVPCGEPADHAGWLCPL